MNLTGQAYRRRQESKHARHPAIAHLGSLEDVERAHVQRVLAQSATFEEAASRLGINLTTLWRKRKRWGLS
jgi:NtrC-family two-component system response regulator AlgB